MKLEMICTGEEVLSGQIIDTNAAWFANRMMDLGVELQRKTTVGDRLNDLMSIFEERSHTADLILVNGGLGPTIDDLSAQAMAQAKGEELVEFTEWTDRMREWYAKHDRSMSPSNLKQAFLPSSAIMIDNRVGTACGFRVKLNRAWLFFTPGVPNEFKHMVEHEFIAFIEQEFGSQQITCLNKLLTFGYGESSLAEDLNQLKAPDNITVGYRSSLPHVEIKLFARGDKAAAALPEFTRIVADKIGAALVSTRASSLAEEVHFLIQEKSKTLCVAESCTGGLVASQLVEFSGSSNYLLEGFVCYSNESKVKNLNVPQSLLDRYGAVSIEVASAMAQGARTSLGCDLGLSITGIAGPNGGTVQKPIGTVVIAVTTNETCWTQCVHIGLQTRSAIRIVSAAVALDMVRRVLLEEVPFADYRFIKREENRVVDLNLALKV